MATQTDIDELDWFHAMDLGTMRTRGRIPPNQPPNFTLFGIFSFLEHIDPKGLDVIDLGTMDGLVAFILKELGASRVVATDLWDRKQFRMARDILGFGSEVEYHTQLNVSDMVDEFGTGTFDLMVFAGVLYHLLSPLESLLHCRRLLRRDALFLIETCYDEESEQSTLRFNMGMEPASFHEPTTYFLPTLPSLLAMLRTASFDPLAVARLKRGTRRVSVLARAVRPSEVREKTPLQRVHDEYVDRRNHFAFGDVFYHLEHGSADPSTAEYSGDHELEDEIDIYSYRPGLPFQPHWG